MSGVAAGIMKLVMLPGGDPNSAVGHGRVTHRPSQRVALRRAAETELSRRGLRLRFREPLETLYDVDQSPFRVRELRQIARLGVAVNFLLIAVINLLVAQSSMLDVLWQATFAPALTLVVSWLLFRPSVGPKLREAGVLAVCCGYSLATIISISLSPATTIRADFFLAALPLIGVLFFARLRFGAALMFTMLTVAGLLGIVWLHPEIPAVQRAYPVVFLLAVAAPAVLGVYRLEHTARRVWLLRLLQSLQVDDLASKNVELSAQAAAALRTSEDRLRQAQKMEAVGKLTGGIAHDFNNLLTTVIGSLDLLTSQAELDATSRRLASNALASAERGARLTGQLLAFSRRQVLAPARLELGAVVTGIFDLLARTLGAKTRLRVVAAHPGQWDALADRNQLEMALLNLVINARDAIGGDEGAVVIAFDNILLDGTEPEAFAADPVRRGEFVEISVEDTGCGMTSEVLSRACEPFFTTKPEGAGTGLGLSQAYGFAMQSGGTLRIDSRPDAGTRVAILLPRAVADAAAPTLADFAPVEGRGETILLAEDDRAARDTIAATLRSLGYAVIEAANGEAALNALETTPDIELLLTDVVMPGAMDGMALALAARAQAPELKVMFISGYSDSTVLARWPEKLDLLQKPFNRDELGRRVGARLQPKQGVLF
jgi:signal transduction histidine kinase